MDENWKLTEKGFVQVIEPRREVSRPPDPPTCDGDHGDDDHDFIYMDSTGWMSTGIRGRFAKDSEIKKIILPRLKERHVFCHHCGSKMFLKHNHYYPFFDTETGGKKVHVFTYWQCPNYIFNSIFGTEEHFHDHYEMWSEHVSATLQ